MQTKKLFFIPVVAILTIALVPPAAVAGSKQRHRWEGVAIGVGAAILGHAVYQAHKTVPKPQRVCVNNERGANQRHRPGYRHGHWEWQRVWVPPSFETVWNPGHYDRKGRWQKGDWIQVQRETGHWTRERVWIAGNHVAREKGKYH
jgi:hypothetical protein